MKADSVKKLFRRTPIWVWIGIVLLIQLLVWVNFVDQHAVNLITNDDFDDLVPLFEDSTLWETFRFQHGPRRMGLGLIVSDFIMSATQWNLRVHTFVMLGFLALTALVMLDVKRKLFGSLVWTDLLIGLLVLNLNQWELLLYLPLNGVVMLFLLALFARIWILEKTYVVQGALLLLAFLIAHTGYGIIFIPVLGLLYLGQWGHQRRLCVLGVFGLMIISGIFFYGYRSQPGLACFQFPHSRPWEYLIFMSLMMSRFFGFVKTTGFAWLLSIAILSVSAYWMLRSFLKKRDLVSEIVFLFIGFSMLYALNAAIGRVCTSVYAGKVSRYVTFLIPQMLGIYFYILNMESLKRRRIYLGILILLTAMSALYFDRRDWAVLQSYVHGREKLMECLKRGASVNECSTQAQFLVYPDQNQKAFEEKFEFLRNHKLNVFDDRP